ncbi:peptidase inhibitor 16-like [Scomber scombrus]|uniref:Peptidase inhibitor 16 n=1 Tax=Scomber scombrus TaxID=13677 RepID=A0AAV1Q0Q4_SCOSC
MHQWSLSELQGVSSTKQEVSSTQQEVSTPRTAQDGASVRATSSRRGSGRRCLCPPTAAPLWAWLLLGALLVPGAWSFLSEEQEELLVELHNHYRGQVSPSASAMLPLKWDPSLKVIAEGYAAKCVWNHNPDLEETGENLFAGTGSLDLREALEKWFLERLDYNYQNNSCDEDKMCGHYTQMVWGDTHRVGCAFHLCNNMEGLDWERVSFLVCNYYPAGNYEEERPYVEGDWCSRCPENLQTCENNLCVADDEEDGDKEVDDEDEDMTVIPPLATSDPSLTPEGEGAEEEEGEEEGEGGVPPPPPTSTGSFIPPTSTPSTTTTTASSQDSEDAQQPATPPPGTHHPKLLPTQQGQEEEITDERKEKEREMAAEREREVVRKANRNMSAAASGGSVASSSLLLACLTGMLTVRL